MSWKKTVFALSLSFALALAVTAVAGTAPEGVEAAPGAGPLAVEATSPVAAPETEPAGCIAEPTIQQTDLESVLFGTTNLNCQCTRVEDCPSSCNTKCQGAPCGHCLC